ncbi:hypothetical protein B0J13DRAFT_567752 [Dactylonectria estremocensis]|uniref:Uncharacterized protein n=1 Tax=Dactylonectria estremocensis TaxID=1079267 RepID=A0A9P9IFS6_9HYPO|nr:hypothetical protein B0J13DRAFT_567752 [Dactylonectria estremocensis]
MLSTAFGTIPKGPFMVLLFRLSRAELDCYRCLPHRLQQDLTERGTSQGHRPAHFSSVKLYIMVARPQTRDAVSGSPTTARGKQR